MRPCFGADGDGGNLSDVGAEGGAAQELAQWCEAATIDVWSLHTIGL